MGAEVSEQELTVGVVVPTIRSEQFERFLSAWRPFWCGDDARIQPTLFVHEDLPQPTVDVSSAEKSGLEIVRTSRADIPTVLGEHEWIIPRQSGACRSFPMLQAWRHGCEYIVTLDDDCLPVEGEGPTFLEQHIAAFTQDRWFRTIDGDDPRGIPYGDRGKLSVLLNHGLWRGIPDLDGPTSLVRMREPRGVVLRAAREVVPAGMWLTLCAMNVCYHRDAIPGAYNLLMGVDSYGFDRFDDIWSGLLLKRIADELGLAVLNGQPFVYHSKASNYFANLRKEALGIHLNEFVWKHIEQASLEGASTVPQAFARLGEWMAELPRRYPEAPDCGDYFARLSKAMLAWGELF